MFGHFLEIISFDKRGLPWASQFSPHGLKKGTLVSHLWGGFQLYWARGINLHIVNFIMLKWFCDHPTGTTPKCTLKMQNNSGTPCKTDILHSICRLWCVFVVIYLYLFYALIVKIYKFYTLTIFERNQYTSEAIAGGHSISFGFVYVFSSL